MNQLTEAAQQEHTQDLQTNPGTQEPQSLPTDHQSTSQQGTTQQSATLENLSSNTMEIEEQPCTIDQQQLEQQCQQIDQPQTSTIMVAEMQCEGDVAKEQEKEDVEAPQTTISTKAFMESMNKITVNSFKKSLIPAVDISPSDITMTELCLQTEFYFTDSNLLHDSYLRTALCNHPKQRVDLKIFLAFNRIKLLLYDLVDLDDIDITTPQKPADKKKVAQDPINKIKAKCVETIKASLAHSKILRVNKNSSQVSRMYPFNYAAAQQASNSRTLFVDKIPQNSTKPMLARHFGSYPIMNINLPLQSNSRTLNKGFCFIEFDSLQTAHLVCEQMANTALQSSDQDTMIVSSISPRIMPYSQWLSEKEAANLVRTLKINDESNFDIVRQPQTEKKNTVQGGCLLQIIEIQVDSVTKSDIVQAARKVFACDFYCDYQQNINKKDTNDLSAVLPSGTAILRFKSPIEQEKAKRRMIDVYRGSFINIKDRAYFVKDVTEVVEARYLAFVATQKAAFRAQLKEKSTKNNNLLKKRKFCSLNVEESVSNANRMEE